MSWEDNQYARSHCVNCIFYEEWGNGRWFGQHCTLDADNSKNLEYPSNHGYDINAEAKSKYNEPCEYFAGIMEIKTKCREKYGFPRWEE